MDRVAAYLAVEQVGEELDDLGDAGGAAGEDDVVDLVLGHLGVAQDLLDGLLCTREERVRMRQNAAGQGQGLCGIALLCREPWWRGRGPC
jgi:hypothetical protein